MLSPQYHVSCWLVAIAAATIYTTILADTCIVCCLASPLVLWLPTPCLLADKVLLLWKGPRMYEGLPGATQLPRAWYAFTTSALLILLGIPVDGIFSGYTQDQHIRNLPGTLIHALFGFSFLALFEPIRRNVSPPWYYSSCTTKLVN
jgi:hypothetical protein